MIRRLFNMRAPLLPRDAGGEAWLAGLIAVLCFLACLAAVGAVSADRAAQGWARALRSEATVQVRPRVGETGAEAAARACLEKAGVNAMEVDGIIVATITGDQLMPSVANLVQHRLGAVNAWGFDLLNACKGFVAALSTATCFIESGRAKRILVIGAEAFSRIVDWSDRNTCVLFGDAAGAFVVEAVPRDAGGAAAGGGGSDDGTGLDGAAFSAMRSTGVVNVGISRSVRVAIMTASEDSRTAAAAA
jgi:hypothetical protein